MTAAQQELIECLASRPGRSKSAGLPADQIWQIAGVFGATALILALFGCFSSRPTAPAPNYHFAEYSKAANYVREWLKSPASASFPRADYKVYDLGGGKLMVSSYVDAQNGFGATIRSEWQVIFQNGEPISCAIR